MHSQTCTEITNTSLYTYDYIHVYTSASTKKYQWNPLPGVGWTPELVISQMSQQSFLFIFSGRFAWSKEPKKKKPNKKTKRNKKTKQNKQNYFPTCKTMCPEVCVVISRSSTAKPITLTQPITQKMSNFRAQDLSPISSHIRPTFSPNFRPVASA